MIRVWLAAGAAVGRAGLAALVAGDAIDVVGVSDLGPGLAAAGEGGGVDVLVVADVDDWPAAVAAIAERIDLTGAALVAVGARPPDGAAFDALPLRGWAVVPDDAPDPAEALAAAIGAAAAGSVAVPGGRIAPWTAWAARTAEAGRANEDGIGAAGDGAAVVRGANGDGREPLTPREREVLVQVANGLSNRQIAHALLISDNTVKFHLSTLFSKLGASSRTEAVTAGLRRGDLTL
ncbi:MAG: response regulator transcription factor [Ardenticatenales bacterium]